MGKNSPVITYICLSKMRLLLDGGSPSDGCHLCGRLPGLHYVIYDLCRHPPFLPTLCKHGHKFPCGGPLLPQYSNKVFLPSHF
jgi:hypothetical protein